ERIGGADGAAVGGLEGGQKGIHRLRYALQTGFEFGHAPQTTLERRPQFRTIGTEDGGRTGLAALEPLLPAFKQLLDTIGRVHGIPPGFSVLPPGRDSAGSVSITPISSGG